MRSFQLRCPLQKSFTRGGPGRLVGKCSLGVCLGGLSEGTEWVSRGDTEASREAGVREEGLEELS